MKMKFIALVLLILPSLAFADNWVRLDQVGKASPSGYEMQAACEAGGNECLKIDGIDNEVSVIAEETISVEGSNGPVEKIVKVAKEDSIKKALKAAAKAEVDAKALNEAALQTKLKRIDHGTRVKALLSLRNDSKVLTGQDIVAMLADTRIQVIKGLLETGSLLTAKGAILAFDVTGSSYFTADDKAALVAEIDAFKE